MVQLPFHATISTISLVEPSKVPLSLQQKESAQVVKISTVIMPAPALSGNTCLIDNRCKHLYMFQYFIQGFRNNLVVTPFNCWTVKSQVVYFLFQVSIYLNGFIINIVKITSPEIFLMNFLLGKSGIQKIQESALSVES